ncbi:protein kinase [Nocardia sp. NBC_00508]|uniref:protein kinase domain-containing protein n=1 Tax=Nocardia sp. NBC_00508 TaxID=2975992 RepID=UPI002E7FE038|nr:protein kinase [Nocardia sp. NBC_00508]WUD66002.1 protein kinase [Nocardia sp. NBC_00508]
MAESDPFKTQRDVSIDAAAELSAAGFEDAEEIGRGGFGVVYRCTQVSLDRTVAVKVLTGELEENRKRFFREQRAMGRLTGHPNIVGVLQVGETETGRPYLVMPYHSQGSLDAQIRLGGPLPVKEVLHLGLKVAGALEAAHRAGVLHRDVKPGNILLTDYGEPALTDFGIAHISGGFETATGAVTGSPAFTAPEVLGGDPPSRASDVYGLGATLFCAVTGHAAFERHGGEQVVAQFLRITTQPVPDLRERGIPEGVSTVIEATMSRDPRERPTAAVLGEQLQRVQLAHDFVVDKMALRAEPGAEQAPPASADSVVQRSVLDRGGDRLRDGLGNLPLELTSFVGRRTQVSEVKNLLTGWRLVTLTGIGGVGKSRLALRVARKLQRDFSGETWLVELSELRDAASLVDVVAAVLGLRNQGGRPMPEVLVEFLSARRLLLVLDNCEQIIEEVAELAESLLRTCPQVRILATSREALGIGGESVFPVSPLGVPDPESEPSLRSLARFDAVTLFVERAAVAVPGFELTEDNRLGVARICARLDGLPLAVELAAARLRMMSVQQILKRLDYRYALLTQGSRGALTRQQTLRGCIGWSYDLCTPAEQRLWGRLSVFAGSFELDTAEEVCGSEMTEQDVLDTLSGLVDKSIVIRGEGDGGVRFRMLETVQEYGKDQLEEAGQYLALRGRHRDWYERLALDTDAQWISPRQLEWIARLERELPNLRTAMEFSLSESDERAAGIAGALFPFWSLRGRLSEGRRWCDRALSRSSDGPGLGRAKALYAASELATLQSDLAAATRYVAELRVLAEQTADPMTSALLANADGYTALVSGDLARASSRLTDAADAFDVLGEVTRHMNALVLLGLTCDLQGDLARALACLEKVLTVAESHGDTVFRSFASGFIGLAFWLQGEQDQATHMLKEAVRLSQLLGNPLVPAFCSEFLAWIAIEKHDARRAAVLLGAAEKLGSIVGNFSALLPNTIAHHEKCERNARKVLGTRAYEAAYQEGLEMSFDAVVGFALGERPQAVTATDRAAAPLTKRERQVADLIAEGLTNKAIATRLVISQRTAQGHVEHILTKLGFTSRTQIAAWAVEHTHDTLE